MKNGKDKNNKGKFVSGKDTKLKSDKLSRDQGKLLKSVSGKDKSKKPKSASINVNIPKLASGKDKKALPSKFPFWARLKLSKHRTTLVIDEEIKLNSKTNKLEDMFVHREATHTYKSEFEKIDPNPDKTDKRAMYLKRPQKQVKRVFEPHNKKLQMPKHLQDKYSKNNKDKDK